MNSWICFKDLVKCNLANGDESRSLLKLLEFKYSVTMGLLTNGLNFANQRAGRIGRLAPKIHPSAQIKNKRRKSQLSVGNKLRAEKTYAGGKKHI